MPQLEIILAISQLSTSIHMSLTKVETILIFKISRPWDFRKTEGYLSEEQRRKLNQSNENGMLKFTQ